MALINFVSDLAPIIPKPNEHFYMGTITHTPKDVFHTIFAHIVNSNTNKLESSYRLECSLMVAGNAYYLYFRKAGEELAASCPYIRTIKNKLENPDIRDWPFSRDSIGLYAEAGLFRDKKIYFSTSVLDAKALREKLDEKYNKPVNSTVITETVYA